MRFKVFCTLSFQLTCQIFLWHLNLRKEGILHIIWVLLRFFLWLISSLWFIFDFVYFIKEIFKSLTLREMVISWKTTITFFRVKKMTFFQSMSIHILKPWTITCMRMSTTARGTVCFTCPNSGLSFFKCLSHCSSRKQLHVKVSHEKNTNIIHYHRILINTNYYWNARIIKYLTDLLWIAWGYKGYFNVFSVPSDKIFESFLIKSVKNSWSVLFKRKVKFFFDIIIVTMTWKMNHFRIKCQNLLKWLKI